MSALQVLFTGFLATQLFFTSENPTLNPVLERKNNPFPAPYTGRRVAKLKNKSECFGKTPNEVFCFVNQFVLKLNVSLTGFTATGVAFWLSVPGTGWQARARRCWGQLPEKPLERKLQGFTTVLVNSYWSKQKFCRTRVLRAEHETKLLSGLKNTWLVVLEKVPPSDLSLCSLWNRVLPTCGCENLTTVSRCRDFSLKTLFHFTQNFV